MIQRQLDSDVELCSLESDDQTLELTFHGSAPKSTYTGFGMTTRCRVSKKVAGKLMNDPTPIVDVRIL